MAGDAAVPWPTKYQNQTGELIVGEDIIELPLDHLSTEDFTQPLQVRTYSNPGRYPSDWYRLAIGEVVIALPEDESLRHNDLPFLPVAVQLKAAPSMEGKSIEFTIEHPTMTNNFAEVRSDDIEDVQIVVKRESTTRFFVWAMALAPVLLIFAAGTQVAISIRHRDHIEPQNVLPLGLGVAVLAILPLRQVLVPSDVQGLTTVDFLLGTELALLIALVAVSTLFRYARVGAASTTEDMGEEAT
jgi:hypothetical protein